MRIRYRFLNISFLFSTSFLVFELMGCGGSPKTQSQVAPAPTESVVTSAATNVAPPLPQQAVIPEDEGGMWTFDNVPADKVEKKYGFKPSKEWLDHVRLSSVRLAGGCSASLVSPHGLVMTNNHCVEECTQKLSNAKKNYFDRGFYAKTQKEELQCPGFEANQLLEITDVTSRVNKVTEAKTAEEANAARKAELSKIETECSSGRKDLRCDVVTLYQGGQYHLYQYKRFDDVRLVFAPEISIAYLGGDEDNFNFPRYNLDSAFLRIYENGKSVSTEKNYFKWSESGAKEGELTFTSGNPGNTSRSFTVAQLELLRDEILPIRIKFLSDARAAIQNFQKKGSEEKRISIAQLLGYENALKAYKGELQALQDGQVIPLKKASENDFRSQVEANPKLKELYGNAWAQISQAEIEEKQLIKPYGAIENGFRMSRLFGLARQLVRAADEKAKPNGERLREYSDARLQSLQQSLVAPEPIHIGYETLKLVFSIEQIQAHLGNDHPFVKKMLQGKSPKDLADANARKQLFEGGKKAIDDSKDPMIAFAKLLDPDAREARRNYENKVESIIKQNSELLGKARFAIYGTKVYPDATFSLRLSFGEVKGWKEGGKTISPFTTLGGTFDHATGVDPYKLPESWINNKAKLNLSIPFNFVTTNDIIGGNSGSPMINQKGEIVGLIFDGNLPSLGGEFFFDPNMNRAVAVHSSAILEALDKIYDAKRVLAGLRLQPE